MNPDDGTTVDTTYTYNCANQLVSDSDGNTYNYDGNGNMTSVEKNGEMVKYYSYDSFKRLNSAYINGVNLYYTYNGDNLRQTKTVEDESIKHVYDGMNVVADIGESTNVYLRSGGELVKNTNINETFTEYKYDSFGEITNSAPFTDNPFTYGGEYQDLCSGLIYLRNRYYDPSIGRFISEDPIRHGTNWYAYANNNPVMLVDPTGLIPSLEDAAEMASRSYNTYDMSISGLESRKLGDGWRLIDEWKGSEGLVIHIYVRGDGEHSSYTGAKEYAFVNKGSSTWGDWANNFQQPFGWSTDMSESIAKAECFSNGDWGNYEITFIGHSKGGAEAAANAVATNRNAILFNPAATALNEYGLNANTYSADMTVYVVKGEPLNALNSLLGAKAIDNYEILPFYSWNPIKNHSMEAVKNGVKGR